MTNRENAYAHVYCNIELRAVCILGGGGGRMMYDDVMIRSKIICRVCSSIELTSPLNKLI